MTILIRTVLVAVAGAGFIAGLIILLQGDCCWDVVLWSAAAIIIAAALAQARHWLWLAHTLLLVVAGWAFLAGLGHELTGPGNPVLFGISWGGVLWLLAAGLFVINAAWAVVRLVNSNRSVVPNGSGGRRQHQ